MKFYVNNNTEKFVATYYYRPVSGFGLNVQAPQDFVANTIYDEYSVVIGDGVFVRDARGEIIYSRVIDNIETYQYPDYTQTYKVIMKVCFNGTESDYPITLPNKNVIDNYERLKSYDGAGLWEDINISISFAQTVTIEYKLNDRTYGETIIKGIIEVLSNTLPLKKWTMVVLFHCFQNNN